MMEAIILAAGKGTRMRSLHPKVLHEICGRPLLAYVLDALRGLGIPKPRVVIGSGAGELRSFIKKWAVERKQETPSLILQRTQRGTGHAVRMAESYLAGRDKDVLIWPGDMPLVKPSTIRDLIRRHREGSYDVSVLSALCQNPTGYGRVIRAGGRFIAIREELDATDLEKRIQEVNTGIYLFKTRCLFEALHAIRPENAKREYYLTDTIEIISRKRGRLEAFPLAFEEENRGINSRMDLAKAVSIVKKREVEYHQQQGVTIVSPDQTYIEPGVLIGQDTVIYPWCYIESGVKIGRGCRIGPFAKLRKGTHLEDGVVIGSFVEVNRSRIGKKVTAKHLTYLGDAVIGEGTNIGAGTITANYDGRKKNRTKIGKKVFIGSDTVLVAPVVVEDHARTGAGAVVTARTKIKKGGTVVGVPARPLEKKTSRKK